MRMTQKETQFIENVYDFYTHNGRHYLPWRQTENPYHIHISEVMLQQTQVDRVLPKYQAFLKKFPTVQSLANTSLGEVIIQWQGLGYNRRAKMLHNCAKQILNMDHSTYPKTHQRLMKLPGIGPYTAGAIMAFAYNQPVPIIETNIRTVYTHHFFSDEIDVMDKDILKLVEATMDIKNPRQWYWALMDYGAYLKREYGSINTRSKHYTKQSKFIGSDRQIRGAIVRTLTEDKCALSEAMIVKTLSHFEDVRITKQLTKLVQEGLITKTRQTYHLPK